jgi:hypothetical protein
MIQHQSEPLADKSSISFAYRMLAEIRRARYARTNYFIFLMLISTIILSATSLCAQIRMPRPMFAATPRTAEIRPGGFDDRPRSMITRAAIGPTPFYGRCNYNFDGALVCVKFPGKGESKCTVTADCYTPTPTPTPTPVIIQSPTAIPAPKLSCICACRSPAATRELLCSAAFVYRVSRIGSICPDKESGWYPWAFERDPLAVPATGRTKYCAEHWNGKESKGFSEKAPTGPSQKCILEQCREGLLRRAWPQ